MRTEIIRRKLYKFNELSKKAKEKALDDHRDWNTDHDWWDLTYEDAENIGLKLDGFDLYQRTIDGKLTVTGSESCDLILKDHGPMCDTYKLAAEYKELFELDRFNRAVLREEGWEEENEDLTDDYRKALLKVYLKMLDEEYKHLESDESISESFECKETEFLASGEMA